MKREQRTDERPQGRGKRIGIVSARFYDKLSDWLEDAARRALTECGVAAEDIISVRVPGCFELPLAAQRMIERRRLDAVVALGVVVRGDTPHFEYIAGECARGLMAVQLNLGIPIGFGILTTETLSQAEERADPARGDKGYDAALAALSVAVL
ncbi:MAG TPA: 6,7-dimethyl-8-ribityllumazine synthase [Candidatus Baltobacteraceae bacterium]|jgi:6,7-dimethyl-8-ribityllumazine synthase|nr:6,7-dimethyl-8-ribityllumazine synthase [Candidatus Baltobacteraceae bacterium]